MLFGCFLLHTMRCFLSIGWSGFPSTSVGLSEVSTNIFWAYKGSPILVTLRGNCDPRLAFSVDVDISILAVMVLHVIFNDFLAVDGVGFLFHSGVQMTLFLETSGVILEFGGVLWLLGGDSDGGRLPGTPVASL